MNKHSISLSKNMGEEQILLIVASFIKENNLGEGVRTDTETQVTFEWDAKEQTACGCHTD